MGASTWEELYKWGFGACKLKPDEFWSMTPIELARILKAILEEEQRQDDQQKQLISWQTAHLMNATGNFKKRIQSSDLYKPLDYTQENEKESEPNQTIVKRFGSPSEKEAYLQSLMKKFNN